MAKRKRPEADSVETNFEVTESEDTGPAEESPVGETAATGSSPTIGWVAGGVPGDTGVGSPQPVVTGELLLEDEQGAKTFWSLLAKVGYIVW